MPQLLSLHSGIHNLPLLNLHSRDLFQNYWECALDLAYTKYWVLIRGQVCYFLTWILKHTSHHHGANALEDMCHNYLADTLYHKLHCTPKIWTCTLKTSTHYQWTLKSEMKSETSFQFSHSVLSNTLQPHGLQQTRLPYSSSTLRDCSNSYPLSLWCHPTISFSVVPFSWLQSFTGSGSFPTSQFLHHVYKVLELLSLYINEHVLHLLIFQSRAWLKNTENMLWSRCVTTWEHTL